MKVVVYFDELPLPEDWKRFGEMLTDGYKSGIGRPPGMPWKVTDEDE